MQTNEQAYIQFNQNFDQLVYIKKSETPLSPSPMKGVDRMMLERRGDEKARRATTVVTYAPDSSFSAHVHPFGEQYYVLEGTFSDHTGDYPQGWYVRNPVNSSHAPFTKQGTRIFVKLGQMPKDQSEHLRLNTNTLQFKDIGEGVSQLVLYESPYESVFLYKIRAKSMFVNEEKAQISQIFIIEGSIKVENIELEKQSWIRIPKRVKYEITAQEDTKIYVKIGKGVVRGKEWNELTFQ